MEIFAAFIVAPTRDHYGRPAIAATTRAVDRGEDGKIGLPGGKLDEGENARDAATREANEEGWDVIGVEDLPFYTSIVEGRLVAWFAAKSATVKVCFKEQGRIKPLAASASVVADSGYGNDEAMAAWNSLLDIDVAGVLL